MRAVHSVSSSLMLAALLAAAPASAQQPPPPPQPPAPPAPQPAVDNEKEAEHLFLAGREAMKKGEIAAAAEKFQKSLDIRSTPGTLLNLAAAEEQLGRLVKALEHFEAAFGALPEGDERRPVARENADRLRPRIPMLRIERAAGAPPDMIIHLDGAPLAASSLGANKRLDPGTYVVTTHTAGREDRRYEVKLAESTSAALAVEPGKELSKGPRPGPPSSGPSLLQTVGAGALGVGVGALGVGVATGVLALVAKGDAASACPDAAHCSSQSGLDAASRSKAFAAVSTASFAVGLAGAAAGVALLVAGRERPATAPTTAIVVPWALPGGAGLGARVRF